MKIKNRNDKKKKLFTILCLCGGIILTVGVALLYLFNTQRSTDSTNDQVTRPATDEQKESGESIKEQSVDSPTESQPNDQSPDRKTVNMEITATSQNQSAGFYQIRSIIHSVQSSGVCTLTLTKGGALIQQQAAVQTLPSASTCQGFDIPLTEFSPGNWELEVIFENTMVTSKATGTITIQ